MFGVVMAFQRFNPFKGFLNSPWVGLENFTYVFGMSDFYQVLWNTLWIATMKIVITFAVSLVLALLLNEVAGRKVKKLIQTTIFIPYFLSWILLGTIFIQMFSFNGPINSLVVLFGGQPILFMADNGWFPGILIGTDVWKNMGYNTVIFLAALTGINPALYEAAEVDGAGRWAQLRAITLPCLMPTILLLLVLSLGGILDAGFDQVLVLYNALVYQSGDVIDTFVYRMGLVNGSYSPAAAVGLFRSVISSAMVGLSYWLAYRFANYKVF